MAPVKGSDSRASAARSVEALQPRKSSEHEMASAKRLQASLKYREALKIQTQKSKMKKSKDVCHPTAQNEQTYLKTGDRRIGLKQVLLNTCSLDHKDWNSSESEKKVDEIIRQMELERQASERAFLERFYEDCKRVRVNPVLYPAPSPQSQSRSADKERRITNLCRHSDKPYLKTGDRRIGLKQVLLNTCSLDHKDWNSSESEKKVDEIIRQMELERQASERAFLERFYEDCKRVRINPVLYPAPSPQSQSRSADKERRITNLCRHSDKPYLKTGDRRIGLKQVLLNTRSLDHKDWNSSESEKKVDGTIQQMELERQASESAFLQRFYEDCKRVRVNPVLYPAPSPQSQSRNADKERRIANLCRHFDNAVIE